MKNKKKPHLHLVKKLSNEQEELLEKCQKILDAKHAATKADQKSISTTLEKLKPAPAPAPHKWARTLDDVYPIAKELLDTIWEGPDRHKTSIRRKHGTSEIMAGRLTGQTDSDYFYFWCPKCKERLRILDFDFRMLRPVLKNTHWKPKPKKEFSLIFKIYCPRCRLTDYVKLSNLN